MNVCFCRSPGLDSLALPCPCCSRRLSGEGVTHTSTHCCFATPRHATSRHPTPCHTTPRHVTSRHTMSFYVMPRHATPRPAMSRHVTPSHLTSCHAISRHVSPHGDTSRHVMSRIHGGTPNLPTKIIPTKIAGLKLSRKFPMALGIPPLKLKILLESNPL